MVARNVLRVFLQDQARAVSLLSPAAILNLGPLAVFIDASDHFNMQELPLDGRSVFWLQAGGNKTFPARLRSAKSAQYGG
ncbi:MAG: hypothetical protein CFE43_21210 [Burkholderiales bacterium PBB3]|nr:MAG: hypothetical protein CFE43_21210 [Burkholderiales bacterium PBB3]